MQQCPRSDDVRTASSVAQRRAQSELGALGVREVRLGGGVATAPDDLRLRSKRSGAGRDDELLLLDARVYDRRAHDAAVPTSMARFLPAGAVMA
jgi:hypothetical protein